MKAPIANMNMTDKGRFVVRVLLILTVLCGLAGFFLDKDPAKLEPIIIWLVVALGAGEAANVGKRATTLKANGGGTPDGTVPNP